MVYQGLHHLERNRLDAPAEAPGVLDDEVAHQQRDVLGPFPKGWKVDRKHVQPIEQVGAKLARLHGVLRGLYPSARAIQTICGDTILETTLASISDFEAGRTLMNEIDAPR
jgi:hypothetical protein